MIYNNKIAWIVPKRYYEVQSRVYKQAHSLCNAGYSVCIFSIKENIKHPKYEEDGLLKIIRIDFPILRKINFPLHKRLLIMPLFTIKVLLKLFKFSPDVTQCMNLPSLHIGFLSKLILRSRYIYDSHELYLDQPNRVNYPLWKKKIIPN